MCAVLFVTDAVAITTENSALISSILAKLQQLESKVMISSYTSCMKQRKISHDFNICMHTLVDVFLLQKYFNDHQYMLLIDRSVHPINSY